jgi:PAS domain S-box-containing protein
VPCFRPTIPTRIPWWLVALLAGGLQVAAILPFWGAEDSFPALPVVLSVLVALLAGVVGGPYAGLVAAGIGWGLFFGLLADADVRALPALVPWAAAGGLAGLVTDRWRRMRGESTVRRNELTALRTVSGEALLTLSPDGTIQAWNAAAEDLYGRRADAVTGEEATVLAAKGREPELLALLEQCRAEGSATAKSVHRRGDGTEITVTTTGRCVRDEDGEVVAIALGVADIGERVEARERLRAAEAKHRALVERLPLVTYTHPPGERKALRPAPQIEKLLGYTPAEWGAEPGLFERLLHPDDRERVLGELEATAEGVEPFRSEYRLVTRAGDVIWLRDEAAPVRDAGGDVAYVQGYLLDVSERRRARQEHERLLGLARAAQADSTHRQKNLDFLAEASGLLASSLDYETTLARLSELVVRDLGDWCLVDVREEDGSFRRLAVAHSEPLRGDAGNRPAAQPEQPIQDVVRRGQARVVAPENGSGTPPLGDLEAESWISVPLLARGRALGALTIVSAGAGRIYGSDELALAEDLAQRAALAVDNARLYREVEERADAARVLTYVGDGVFLLDRAGVVRLWNPAAESITGLTAPGVVGHPVAEAIPGWQALVDRIPVVSSNEPGRAETVPVETSKGERWISISGVEFFGGTVYAFRDVTEERRLDELKAEFVATASHELRTPLAAVYGAAQTLRRHDFVLDEAGRDRFLSLIVDESERLGRIVSEILLANQLDADRLDVSREPFDPADLVERVVDSVRTHTPPGVTIDINSPPSVPLVGADRDRARQVLVNLLENAIKYSPDGGGIEVGLDSGHGMVSFSVSDEGLGIPADYHERIFEKFYRLDPDMTRGVGGTGLGLYICSELVSRMGGSIWVDSVEGKGSSFTFELPMAEPELTPAGAPQVDETIDSPGAA